MYNNLRVVKDVGIAVAAEVRPLLDDLDRPTGLLDLLREDRSIEPGAHYQKIVLHDF
jgi:hypothetical protein